MEETRQKDGKFPKGVSGNPSGKPKGFRQKLTTTQMADEVAKGDVEALNALRRIIRDPEHGKHLTATMKYLDVSLELRKLVHKITMDKKSANLKEREMKQKEKAAGEIEDSFTEDTSEIVAPVLNLVL